MHFLRHHFHAILGKMDANPSLNDRTRQWRSVRREKTTMMLNYFLQPQLQWESQQRYRTNGRPNSAVRVHEDTVIVPCIILVQVSVCRVALAILILQPQQQVGICYRWLQDKYDW